ncbi:GSCOCG00010548001-RA-CDS [Cotesia congregata]|nr:GSCOCG00010548001-RA-CDS [Cotesia congregata]
MEIIEKCAKTSKRRKRLNKNRRKNRNKYYNKCKIKNNYNKQFNDTQSYDNLDNKHMIDIMGFHVPDSFWETYKFAQDWQHKHQVAWWRSKCVALEHENLVLKNKIREIINNCNHNHVNCQHHQVHNYENRLGELENAGQENNEELEFEIDEGMMKFLEQSARHKKELKRKRELEAEEAQVTWVSHENDDKIKLEETTLLYGKDKSKIIAIETRMQVEVDQYKTQHQPEYWPIIPLKL